ncbi:hypothetical protein Ahy_B08g089012 [Arachis hypogaea]|uniref:Uncharacterized protein n=1 Tax=Arachis hypogaea TaxID=3818 RepID=A0A444XWF4_ARAHY|nr:hypothetical protein Ahy_B08g089012 [Arachis hypogaea]
MELPLFFRLLVPFDGQPLLASGGSSGSVVREAHDSVITSLHFFANEPVLMSSSADNSIKMWILHFLPASVDQQSRELSQHNVSRRAKKLKVKKLSMEEEIKLKPVIAFDCGGLFLCYYSFSSNFAEEMELKLIWDDEEEAAAAERASEVNFTDEISGINTGSPSPTSSNESSVTS